MRSRHRGADAVAIVKSGRERRRRIAGRFDEDQRRGEAA